ncbi:MAG: DUF4258 domain-containing protein, partial [Candidatus Omnitrophota bacterium]|nr:DUF4258 domain-containing protein [Candidatus Omnitrophota bacterium]
TMKHIIFSKHAIKQMTDRGASKEEVAQTIREGETFPAKHGRIAYRHNFQYNSRWGNKFYHIKQVMPITKEEISIIVITVYTLYF